MTGPELDALIANVENTIATGEYITWMVARELINELKIYRAMALRLERCVHELVKEAESCES